MADTLTIHFRCCAGSASTSAGHEFAGDVMRPPVLSSSFCSTCRDLRVPGIQGHCSISWAFLTQTPKPPGEAGGGMANAIAGSALILLLGSRQGVPIGIGAGIYLAEYGRNRFGMLIRFTADVLNGVPPSWSASSPTASWWCRGAFFSRGWRSCPGDHDDSHNHSHY